jgi:phosphatidylserine/phosphatidylglycerophosphate/cardiolipin synthase-like enzyme
MPIELVVRPGVDSAFLAWRTPFIAGCRGFALTRRVKRAPGSAPSPTAQPDSDGFAIETVSSWVGFADQAQVAPGTRKPTTEWPIQKYLWSDFMVNPGDQAAFRVTPMMGRAGQLTADEANASPWSPVVEIGAETAGNISCYFNRGIVASQWLARLLPQADPSKALTTIIATPGDKTRNFLGGPIHDKLTGLLKDTCQNDGHVYAALFELDDPELIPLLQAFGQRAHIVLGNGSVKKKGDDENAEARAALRMCEVHDRMTAPRALAHNKFLVICDSHQTPQAVWTGSTNWTKTGLCTQANNAVLVRNVALAQDYLDQWKTLSADGDASPPSLISANGTPRTVSGLDGTTLWFTPLHGQADLEQAGEMIRGAREGILFLMFNPGPRGTLFNDIIDLASPSGQHYDPDLYIQGVLNQNPGTAKNPVTLFNRGQRIDTNEDVVLPAQIPGPFTFWRQELLKLPRSHAMVHSKVIVVDPYGEHPVVMTGSHNMGPKASGVNDENLLIIEGDGVLASQYAGQIMQIYSQYRWRQSVQAEHGQPHWTGLADSDAWQIGSPTAKPDEDTRRLHELKFWFGEPIAASTGAAADGAGAAASGAAAPAAGPAAAAPAPAAPVATRAGRRAAPAGAKRKAGGRPARRKAAPKGRGTRR